MSSPSFIALPDFAPLPVPMVLHTMRLSESQFLERAQHAPEQLRARLRLLREQLDSALNVIYPMLLTERESREKAGMPLQRFQQHVADFINQKSSRQEPSHQEQAQSSDRRAYSISLRTTLTWRTNHLILPPASRQVDWDRAAAILALSMIDERKQGFLPAMIDPGEPHMWCYALTAPGAAVLPCPLPLPRQLRPGTLLFMRWPTFQPDWTVLLPSVAAELTQWQSIHPFVAMRFSSIDQHSLSRWDERFSSQEFQLIYGNLSHRAVLQRVTESLFYQLAPRLLSTSFFPPTLPLLFEKRAWEASLF